MLLALLFVVLLMLAACGPDKSASESDELATETARIAREYAQDGDIDRARIGLQGLDVANPMQWLVYQAEAAITDAADADDTRALATLAIDLGSQSHMILEYGVTIGAVAAPASEQEVASTTGAVPGGAPEAPQANAAESAAAAPTVAVIPLDTTQEEPAGATEPATPTPQAPPDEPTPAPTAIPVPQVVASTTMNVRGGPGTAYPVVDDMGSGETADIVAKNAQSDWWQVKLAGDQLGWVFGQLVETSGDLGDVVVAANIPEPPPPTATPVPVAEPEEPAAEEPPAEEPPAEEAPPPGDGPDFRVIEKRLWDVYENGGSLSGPTVTCGEKRQLVVRVLDANGGLLNGVSVQEEFGAKDIQVTGAQGKGDGTVEFILGRGQDVKVVRDADGRDVTSEVARGMVTEPAGIPYDMLIGGQYCTDDASCKKFVDAPGCWGHYSWTVTFQRKY